MLPAGAASAVTRWASAVIAAQPLLQSASSYHLHMIDPVAEGAAEASNAMPAAAPAGPSLTAVLAGDSPLRPEGAR
jgi:hypothetical protein